MVMAVEKTTKEYFSVLNAHDFEKMVSFYNEDAVDECLGSGTIMQGKNEIKSYFKEMANSFPDFKFEIKNYFESGNWSAVEWILSGTHSGSPITGIPPSGKHFSFRGVDIVEKRNGKISHTVAYWNMMDFLKQVGMAPPMPSK